MTFVGGKSPTKLFRRSSNEGIDSQIGRNQYAQRPNTQNPAIDHWYFFPELYMDILLLTLLFIGAGCGIEWRRSIAEKEREHFIQLRAHWLRTVYGAKVGCDYGDYYCAWTEQSCRKIHFFDEKGHFEKFRELYGVPAQTECKVWTQKIPGIEEIWELKQV